MGDDSTQLGKVGGVGKAKFDRPAFAKLSDSLPATDLTLDCKDYFKLSRERDLDLKAPSPAFLPTANMTGCILGCYLEIARVHISR